MKSGTKRILAFERRATAQKTVQRARSKEPRPAPAKEKAGRPCDCTPENCCGSAMCRLWFGSAIARSGMAKSLPVLGEKGLQEWAEKRVCVHLGKPTSEVVRCRSCKNAEKINVMRCDLYEKCLIGQDTAYKGNLEIKFRDCNKCESFMN